MNKRIRELAKEARLLTGWPIGQIELEKFAELIAKECAYVAGCNGHVSGFALGDLIKQHFEVEE